MKCYTRQRNDGSKYTTCNKDAQTKPPAKRRPAEPVVKRAEIRRIEQLPEADRKTKIDLRSQNKNVSNNKMSKTDPRLSVHKQWVADQRKFGSEIMKLLPDDMSESIFGHTSAKAKGGKQRAFALRVRQLPTLEKYASDEGSAELKRQVSGLRTAYNSYRKARAEATDWGGRKSKKAGGIKPTKAPAKMKMKKEDEVRPASRAKAAPKKVSVSYRVGSGPMKTAPGIVGKTSTSRKVVATKKPVVKKPDRRKSSAPMKNAKTAPQKVARFDMASGRTGNAIYEALGEGLGIPRYGNVVTPGQVMLKRNRRK